MMTFETADLIEATVQRGLGAWGQNKQTIKAVEEMAELSVNLCKVVNGASASIIPDVIDEIADVIIMAHSMRQVFGPSEVDERIRQKCQRTLDIIEQRQAAKAAKIPSSDR